MSEPTSADSLRSPPGLLEALTGTARPEQGSEWSPPASGFRLQPASGSSSQNAEVLCGSGRGCGSWSRSSGLSLEAALPGVVDVRGRRAPSDRSRRRRREELVRPAGPLRTGRARRRAAPRGSWSGDHRALGSVRPGSRRPLPNRSPCTQFHEGRNRRHPQFWKFLSGREALGSHNSPRSSVCVKTTSFPPPREVLSQCTSDGCCPAAALRLGWNLSSVIMTHGSKFSNGLCKSQFILMASL